MICAAICYLFDACSTNPYKSGEVLYQNFCAHCHGENGNGLGDIYPPINNSDYLKMNADNLVCLIRYGQTDEIIVNGKSYKEPMPPLPKLDEVALNNIVNFINYKWPFKEGNTTIIDIRNQLENCN